MMEKEKVKVIFRKDKHGEIVAFFPEGSVNYGNIMSYMHIGQHGEASLEFYQSTKKATYEEYKPLLVELMMIYHGCDLMVKQKLYYKDLREAWRI